MNFEIAHLGRVKKELIDKYNRIYANLSQNKHIDIPYYLVNLNYECIDIMEMEALLKSNFEDYFNEGFIIMALGRNPAPCVKNLLTFKLAEMSKKQNEKIK